MTPTANAAVSPDEIRVRRLREEAAIEPDPVATSEAPKKETQVIAIYGKGGIGRFAIGFKKIKNLIYLIARFYRIIVEG